jgi:hypothetical protein
MSRRGSAEEGETARQVAGRTALDGRGRDVGDEADEDEAPQVRVAPGLEDVLAGDFASSEREEVESDGASEQGRKMVASGRTSAAG